ncbi:hypothetical protein CLOM_g18909, partial [Closterium sp. NIES-68]
RFSPALLLSSNNSKCLSNNKWAVFLTPIMMK